jgi:hypothetical protein
VSRVGLIELTAETERIVARDRISWAAARAGVRMFVYE